MRTKLFMIVGISFAWSSSCLAIDFADYVKIIEIDRMNFKVKVREGVPRLVKSQCSDFDLAYWAAGSECQKRGFGYFDISQIEPNLAHGLCLKQDKKAGLGIEFESPGNLKVMSAANKAETLLKEGDLLIEISGKKVSNIGELKKVLLRSAANDRVKLKVRRGADTIEVKESLMIIPAVATKDIWALHSMCLDNVPKEFRTTN